MRGAETLLLRLPAGWLAIFVEFEPRPVIVFLVLRCQGDRLFLSLSGLVEIARCGVGDSKAPVVRCILRTEPDGFFVVGDRFVELAAVPPCESAIAVDRRILRIEPDRFVEIGDRFVELAYA
jgi:hypothetical protein